ncbi:MAG TPA: hypothetical protein VGV09_17470 [Steroidobacteraceae bacterium]|nr:hypothetical protein [Steroidobacteraceae bacterium]
MLRSVLAVLLGIITLTVISFAVEAGMDPLLLRLFPHTLPNEAALGQNLLVRALMFVYGAASIVAGGYVTAWVARRAPVGHALVMGLLQSALTIVAMFAVTTHASTQVWLISAVMAVPAAWLGGLIYVRRERLRNTAR